MPRHTGLLTTAFFIFSIVTIIFTITPPGHWDTLSGPGATADFIYAACSHICWWHTVSKEPPNWSVQSCCSRAAWNCNTWDSVVRYTGHTDEWKPGRSFASSVLRSCAKQGHLAASPRTLTMPLLQGSAACSVLAFVFLGTVKLICWPAPSPLPMFGYQWAHQILSPNPDSIKGQMGLYLWESPRDGSLPRPLVTSFFMCKAETWPESWFYHVINPWNTGLNPCRSV